MARVFITGSAEGLGQLAAQALVDLGHIVVLHARNERRATEALAKVPKAAGVLTADLSSMEETKALAAKANAIGKFDAIIHNAGVYRVPKNSVGAEGLPLLFTVNSLAPYILTCLMHKPDRLIYLSSGMHLQGNAAFNNLPTNTNNSIGRISYSDTKLHDVVLAMAVARRWPDVYSNAVDPGWVPTRMGGAGAPGNLEQGFQTQVWLAVSDDVEAKTTGRYLHHKKEAGYLPAANDIAVQEKFLSLCEGISNVGFEHRH